MRDRYRILLLLTVTALVGCGQAKIQPNNLRLTVSLRTALSTRSAEGLEQNVAAIEKRHAAGDMEEEEYAAFLRIVAQAKSGDWEGAERATVRLQKAQRPTQEQIDRLPKPPTDN